LFQHQGIWLPDGEKHFPEWMDKNGELVDGKGTYQIKKWRACFPHIKEWRTAVDVGAHVGLWSMHLVKRFACVIAFEPMVPFRACFERNVGAENVTLLRNPLGAREANVGMHYDPADSGGTHVAPGGDMKMRRLDSFQLEAVDFLKIDCEGYELEVLKGAQETLERCRPCVIVEQKAHKLGPNFGIRGTPAVDFLIHLGARQRAVLSGDYILSWD
jgi:FkbM family methyltransferase